MRSVSMVSLKFFSFVLEIFLFNYKYFNITVDKIQGKGYYQIYYLLIMSCLKLVSQQILFSVTNIFLQKMYRFI